ncbi:MAG TPA: FadR/GntR family transcriptional regulator [Gaiellaceae bacterium]
MMDQSNWHALPALEETAPENETTRAEQVAARIRELIESGRLGAGERLPAERRLAEILGVSRLSVREGLRGLEALDLVVVRRGAGTFVRTAAALESPPPPAVLEAPRLVDVEELFEVRRLLEPAAAEWAARRGDPRNLVTLHRLLEEFDLAAGAADKQFVALADCDIRLHDEIALCAGNALLSQLLVHLHGLHRLQLEWSLRRPRRLDETAAEHRRIVDAITSRDPEGACEAMKAHLAAAEAAFRTVSGGEGLPLD